MALNDRAPSITLGWGYKTVNPVWVHCFFGVCVVS